MDGIEKLFGISPDGGDGTMEGAIVFACVLVAGAVLMIGSPRLRARVRGIFQV
jgi:hypothetical protein